ncbi:hypothetical protein FQA39_LY13049 [Lamprigera yunnana]|nr:hypothetical protein FQA39_LY13049 [Lamprigera yunnana]
MARNGFTHQDFWNLIVIYGEMDRMAAYAYRTFIERYPERPRPSEYTIQTLEQICLNLRSFVPPKQLARARPIVQDEANIVNVLGYFTANEANFSFRARTITAHDFIPIQKLDAAVDILGVELPMDLYPILQWSEDNNYIRRPNRRARSTMLVAASSSNVDGRWLTGECNSFLGGDNCALSTFTYPLASIPLISHPQFLRQEPNMSHQSGYGQWLSQFPH